MRKSSRSLSHLLMSSCLFFCQHRVASCSVNSSFYTGRPRLAGGRVKSVERLTVDAPGFDVADCILKRSQNILVSSWFLLTYLRAYCMTYFRRLSLTIVSEVI